MSSVLLAGATGYLGSFIAKQLTDSAHELRVLARSPERLTARGIEVDDVFKAEVTDPGSLADCCRGIDVVISTVGITRQKDGLTYKDVDYRANLNLLNEARASGVKKFIYVSVLNGDKLRHLKICDAKETFVDTLKESGLEYCVIRPNGFFSDMAEFLEMAKKGRVYVLGGGEQKSNPIHGADLAAICVGAIEKADAEIKVGGPETLSYNEIAKMAFDVAGTAPKIVHIPDWLRRASLMLLRVCTPSTVYGPIEFFLTVTAIDMVAPQFGTHSLREHFISLV